MGAARPSAQIWPRNDAQVRRSRDETRLIISDTGWKGQRMKAIDHMPIGWRVASGFVLAVALLAGLTGLSIYQGQVSKGAVSEMVGLDFVASSKMQAIDGNVIRIHRAMKDVALSKTPQMLETAVAPIAGLEKAIDDDLAVVGQAAVVPAQDVDAVRAALDAWQKFRRQTVELMREGKADEAAERTRAEGATLAKQLIGAVTKVVAGSQAQARRQAEATISTIQATSLVMLGACAMSVVLLLAYGVLVVRSMKAPMVKALALAESVATGDLCAQVEMPEGRDEFSRLLQALCRMNANLVDIIHRVRASSDSIATGSAQIATGNADLSQRTEQQASNLQQTAASMEELSGTVKLSADTASQANQLAATASAAAVKGGEMVGQVVSTMQEIAHSSKKIADIIGVIDGIAFQTNILALNAAVEAARAGEQGRGFAVVASEVRSLAGRSAEAAREIKSLISASVEKVDAGARLVDETGASMGEIVAQVQRVSQMISELSGAAGQQAAGIGQVGEAVAQIDQVTQQNAALVEESAAAAESLKQQAAKLAELVSVFKLGGGMAAAPAL
ncbi:MAG: MCP four helix bundle domain-containing protein [Rubrivivax sp.]|nr:MCP four helix bundle domain-containing protein [Rubrivivax sp.]